MLLGLPAPAVRAKAVVAPTPAGLRHLVSAGETRLLRARVRDAVRGSSHAAARSVRIRS